MKGVLKKCRTIALNADCPRTSEGPQLGAARPTLTSKRLRSRCIEPSLAARRRASAERYVRRSRSSSMKYARSAAVFGWTASLRALARNLSAFSCSAVTLSLPSSSLPSCRPRPRRAISRTTLLAPRLRLLRTLMRSFFALHGQAPSPERNEVGPPRPRWVSGGSLAVARAGCPSSASRESPGWSKFSAHVGPTERRGGGNESGNRRGTPTSGTSPRSPAQPACRSAGGPSHA